GSDYSASAIGGILRASRVELVKRDVSVRSGDPRWVPEARPIARLSHAEREELAQFGAKVLHPFTIEPARRFGFDLVVSSLDDPASPTTIGPSTGARGVRAVACLRPLSMLALRIPGGRSRPGLLAANAQVLSRAGINVVSLLTSAAELGWIVRPEQAGAARRALEAAGKGSDATLDRTRGVALVTAVG